MANKVKSDTLKTRTAPKRSRIREEEEPAQSVEEQEEEDGVVLAAEDAEPEPEPEAAPEAPAPSRRGRPKGTRTRKAAPAAAEPTIEDLYSALCQAGFTIKRLAAAHGKTPEQVLNAVGHILSATAELEEPAANGFIEAEAE